MDSGTEEPATAALGFLQVEFALRAPALGELLGIDRPLGTVVGEPAQRA